MRELLNMELENDKILHIQGNQRRNVKELEYMIGTIRTFDGS